MTFQNLHQNQVLKNKGVYNKVSLNYVHTQYKEIIIIYKTGINHIIRISYKKGTEVYLTEVLQTDG